MNSKILQRIRKLLSRASIRRVKYASKVRFFQIQQQGGTALDNVEHIEPFGFTSHPAADAEAIVLAFNGNGSHSVAIMAGDQRYRLEIEEGECAIYNISGDKVHIKKDRTISVEAATKVLIDTPEVEMTGKLVVAETIAAGDWIESGAYVKAATKVEAGTNVEATVNVLAGANVTATALVSGATIATASGAATMGASGEMQVTALTASGDVTAGGKSVKSHTHTDSEGGTTSGPQ